MSASEKLREAAAEHSRVTPIFRKTDTIHAGADAFTRDRETERLMDALPLIADGIAALEQYAAATNWAVLRDDGQPVMCWIGPGAEELPMPRPLGLARDALTALQEYLEEK